MGNTRDVFKKTGDTKGTFHSKMGTIKDRNSKDLTEADEIKKRWQECTELYKKGLNDLNNHDGVITQLEPDILECPVKWALGSITMNKTSGGDAIPVELFQILKDDAAFVDDATSVTIYKALCLFKLYAEYIMRNAGLDEAQVGVKIAGRNINNL